ncbi:CoA transferase [Mycobacterium intracellulare]|uniref:CaiB/BaiF CoA transferase family protein n=1 Tax=Mycobacterium intracellulare TaxID=1767 RepID=UPI00055E5C5A|nr:CoA transferase [Mycobacterium intracellulare]MCA2273523.1 CoA transferase [Mycobacterium intracellulare]
MNSGPLAGVRVVEAGRFASAPSCATILADWGADVIKIEPPGGDPARGAWTPTTGRRGQPVNPRFDVHNRTRRSVVMDMSQADGRALARRLIGTADVFVTNMRTTVLQRMELDNDTLRDADPRLVYAQVTAYGAADDNDLRSYDHGAFWSYSGLAALYADDGGRPPQPTGGMGDRAAGSALAGAVCAALFARERTGRGDYVTVSLLRTAMWLMASDVADVLRNPGLSRSVDRLTAPIPTLNCFRCADGQWLWLQSMLPAQDWDRLLTALDAQWLDDDPRFRGGTELTLEKSRIALVEALDEIFRQHPRDEWCRRLAAAGLTVSPVHSLAEAVRDPLVMGSGAFLDVAHDAGDYVTVNSPCSFAESPPAQGTPPPGAGEHTDEVLAELGAAGTMSMQRDVP